MRTYFIKTPQWLMNVYPDAIWSNTDSSQILWTIDDGPHPDSTPAWLDFLSNRNIKAIFFLRGDHCLQYPWLMKRICEEGHVVGSHGFSHLDGWKTSTAQYLADVERSMDVIPAQLFRPPYGRMTPQQYCQISKRFLIMMWTIMIGDFDENVKKEDLLKRTQILGKGDIVVMHDSPDSFEKASCLMEAYLSIEVPA